MINSYYMHSWGPSAFGGAGVVGALIGLLLIAIVIVLKGYALWNASKRNEKWWFIVLLIVNTMGILELIYLIFIAKKWPIKGSTSSTNKSSTPPTA